MCQLWSCDQHHAGHHKNTQEMSPFSLNPCENAHDPTPFIDYISPESYFIHIYHTRLDVMHFCFLLDKFDKTATIFGLGTSLLYEKKKHIFEFISIFTYTKLTCINQAGNLRTKS